MRDPAAASEHFWQPTREYNQLFAELGLAHAREEYGWGDDFAAAIKAEAPDERRRRVSEFRTWTAKLMREQDEQALTVDKAKQAIALLDKEPTMMPVASARGMDDATLDAMGFTALAHESAVSSWDDWRLEPKSTAQLYAAETAALVKEHTGASHVFCTPRKLRATDGAKGSQPPLHGVHADFGPGYVDELAGVLDGSETTPQAMTLGLAKQLTAAGITAAELRASRVVVLNSWRALGEAPTARQPLALVDRRTVEAEDVAMIEMPPGVSSAHALRLSYARPRDAVIRSLPRPLVLVAGAHEFGGAPGSRSALDWPTRSGCRAALVPRRPADAGGRAAAPQRGAADAGDFRGVTTSRGLQRRAPLSMVHKCTGILPYFLEKQQRHPSMPTPLHGARQRDAEERRLRRHLHLRPVRGDVRPRLLPHPPVLPAVSRTFTFARWRRGHPRCFAARVEGGVRRERRRRVQRDAEGDAPIVGERDAVVGAGDAEVQAVAERAARGIRPAVARRRRGGERAAQPGGGRRRAVGVPRLREREVA